MFVWFICMCCGLALCLTGWLKSKIRGTGFVFLWRCVLWIMQISFRQTDLSHCVSSLSNHSVSFRCPCLVFTHILCVFVPSGVLLVNAFKVLVRIRDLHAVWVLLFFPASAGCEGLNPLGWITSRPVGFVLCHGWPIDSSHCIAQPRNGSFCQRHPFLSVIVFTCARDAMSKCS